MAYQIVIPSYKRTKQLQQRTLRVLSDYGFAPGDIHVWVADKDEENDYRKALGDEYVIRVGVVGLAEQRNLIERSYPEGTWLVMMDDDIEAVETLGKEHGERLKPVQDLEAEVFKPAFAACVESGAKFWGIYAARNHYFMKHRIYAGLCYCVGSFFGVIVDHHNALLRQRSHGEDYEYTLRQYQRNGIVRRMDYITVKSNYYKEEGGLQCFRTPEMMEESIQWIARRFPGLCKVYHRKNGQPELRLRDVRKQRKGKAIRFKDI